MKALTQVAPDDSPNLGGPHQPTRSDLRRQKASGYTLLEVAIAAFVMLFGIASALTALRASFRLIDVARYTTLAGQVLESQMEKLRLLNWTQLTDPTHVPGLYDSSGNLLSSSSLGTTFAPDVAADGATQSLIASHFYCTQRIDLLPTSGTPTARITLTTRWTGTDGHAQSVSYSTIYARNGISDFYYPNHVN